MKVGMTEASAASAASTEPPAQRQKLEGTSGGPNAKEAELLEAEERVSASLAFSHDAVIDDEPEADANDALDIQKLSKTQHELVKRAVVKGGFADPTRLQFHASVRADFVQIIENGRDATVKNSIVLLSNDFGVQL